ncbi:MAG: hypothetical protein JWR59_2082, partial [Brevundimonas sp.]|nr:hypothetical protein [Brevundimonas sp.]
MNMTTSPAAPSLRRNLVFARVGKGSLHRKWSQLPASDRQWDIQLSTYLDDQSDFVEGDLPLSIDKGTKWDSIFRYFTQNPELLDKYDYIYFPDDDLDFTAKDVGEIFRLCTENDLFIS